MLISQSVEVIAILAPVVSMLIGCADGRRSIGTKSGKPFPQLELTEVAHYPIGNRENVRGGLALGGGAAFFWTRGGAWVTRQRDHSPARLRGPALTGIVGARRVGTVVHVVDTASRSILEVALNGGCRRIHRLPPGSIASAAFTGSSWLTLTAPAVAGTQLRFLRLDGGAWTDGMMLPHQLTDSGHRPWLFVAPRASGAVLGSRKWPFPWLFLGALGNVEAASSHTDLSLRAEVAPAELGSGWIGVDSTLRGLPPLDLGPAYLHVISDIITQRRLARLVKADGRLIRSRWLPQAVGFVASDNSSHELVGIRTGQGRTLVVFRWRWHNYANNLEDTK